jgi:predicted nucleic acid-binding protein
VAETLGLSLVTHDRELLRKSPAAIDVDTFLARL